MHSDPRLTSRIEAATRGWPGLAPKKMFGGMAWLLHGNMCAGVWHESLVVRCDPADWPAHLKRKHVREMDITGRSMKGWLLVDPPAIATAAGLRQWLETSRRFVATLPKKSRRA
jgi:TfoX/Sxy family transcriptional regulator of competence genes